MMHKVQREITQKVLNAELPFLHSAHHLMLIDISIKFCEYSLCSFQVIERTQFFFLMHKVQREITKKSIKGRVTILAFCTSSHADLYLYKNS